MRFAGGADTIADVIKGVTELIAEKIGGSALLFAPTDHFASAIVPVGPNIVVGESDLLTLTCGIVLVGVRERVADHRRGVDAGEPVQAVVGLGGGHGRGTVVLEGNLAHQA